MLLQISSSRRPHSAGRERRAKKAGSQLKSRIVAEKPVADCAKLIEQLEGQISTIFREERRIYLGRSAED
nr:unnamed protein product [Digitaria exilis]